MQEMAVERELTLWLVDDGARAIEVARPVGPAVVLVVAVERVGGMRDLSVWLETRRAGLNGAAVGAMTARVLQRRLEPCVPNGRVRHAPAPAGVCPGKEQKCNNNIII